MLPKLQNSSLANTLRRDNLAFQMQCEDQLKGFVSRSNNENYKPWKN